jgi:putative addiction module component (TIGR02574 family)
VEDNVMVDFNSVLRDAQQLSEDERLLLCDMLRDSVPNQDDLPLHEEWDAELERRSAAIDDGSAVLTPWEKIYSDAMKRIEQADDR